MSGMKYIINGEAWDRGPKYIPEIKMEWKVKLVGKLEFINNV